MNVIRSCFVIVYTHMIQGNGLVRSSHFCQSVMIVVASASVIAVLAVVPCHLSPFTVCLPRSVFTFLCFVVSFAAALMPVLVLPHLHVWFSLRSVSPKGAEDEDARMYDGTHRLRTDRVIVSKAGLDAVNGVYHRDGTFDNAGKYTKTGHWNNGEHVFSLFRCNVSNNTRHWYISIVPSGVHPGTSTDIDFYSTPVSRENPDFPPSDGWTRAKEGLSPVPIVTIEEETGPDGDGGTLGSNNDNMLGSGGSGGGGSGSGGHQDIEMDHRNTWSGNPNGTPSSNSNNNGVSVPSGGNPNQPSGTGEGMELEHERGRGYGRN